MTTVERHFFKGNSRCCYQERSNGIWAGPPQWYPVLYSTDILWTPCCCCSGAKLCPTLLPHGLQHTRLPCPSLSPGLCSNSCPLSWSCHPVISSCHPLLLLPSIFPSIRVFSKEVAFVSGDQSIGASASVLPMNIQGWFPLGLTSWISLLSKGLSRVFSNTTIQKHQFFSTQPFLWSNSHIHTWLLEKPWLWLWTTNCKPLLAKWCLCSLIHCLGLS